MLSSPFDNRLSAVAPVLMEVAARSPSFVLGTSKVFAGLTSLACVEMVPDWFNHALGFKKHARYNITIERKAKRTAWHAWLACQSIDLRRCSILAQMRARAQYTRPTHT